MKFSLEKRLVGKRKWIYHTPSQTIIPADGLSYKME